MGTRRTLRLGSMTAIVLVALASCVVPPGPGIDADWGAELPPAIVDAAYGPEVGCGMSAFCDGSQTFDVWPATSTERGTIVWVHGGGFRTGDKQLREQFGPILAQHRRGWTVVAANYRLAPFPAAVDDIAALVEHLDAVGYQRPFVLAGHSAGATIAALVAYFPGMARVDGLIGVACLCDFTLGGTTAWWGHQWFPPRVAPIASPVIWWDPTDPPTYLIHGTGDPWAEPANALNVAARAAADGVAHRVILDLVDMGHYPIASANAETLAAFLDAVPY